MKSLILLLILTIFVSCSHSIKIRTNSNRFISSEAQGKLGKGKIEFYAIQGNTATIDLRNEQTDNPLDLSRESSSLIDLSISGELGIWGPVDLFHVGGGSKGSDLTGFKVQIYGDKRVDAKKYNFSVSIFSGYGQVTNNVEEGDDIELVPADDDTTSEFLITAQTTGVLIGYRPEEKIQVTLGHQIVLHNFTGDLESQNSNLDGKSINYSGKSALTSLTTTYELSKSAIVSLEFASDNQKWDKTNVSHNVFTNIALGFMW